MEAVLISQVEEWVEIHAQRLESHYSQTKVESFASNPVPRERFHRYSLRILCLNVLQISYLLLWLIGTPHYTDENVNEIEARNSSLNDVWTSTLLDGETLSPSFF